MHLSSYYTEAVMLLTPSWAHSLIVYVAMPQVVAQRTCSY